MKLDATVMRSMNSQDFRVMEAVEKGMKDHYLVPMPLITAIANLRHGGTHKIMSSLLRDKMISHERKGAHDGYRLTNAGYDILALHNLKSRGFIAALGQRVGTGKESDVYLAANPEGKQIILKFHRLGRTSFRNVKKKRDYFGSKTQQAHSWLFLSRLSALKEFAFMKALYNVEYPTPTPIAQNRHIVAMSLVRGIPLYQVFPKQLSVYQAADIYEQAARLATRLAQHGLVHCDLNEFNLLVDLSGIQAIATNTEDTYVRHSGQSIIGENSMGKLSKPAWEQSLEANDRIDEATPEPTELLPDGKPKPVVILIDFPQMISIKHPNAKEYYERDLACLKRFFEMKLHCNVPEDIGINTAWEDVAIAADDRLDDELRASGASDTLENDLELYYFNSVSETVQHDTIEEKDDEFSDDESSGQSEKDFEKDSMEDKDLSFSDEEDNHSRDDSRAAASVVSFSPSLASSRMDRSQIEEIAKARVRKQLEERKKRAKKQGAFRKGNSNKTYVKGRRVVEDFGLK